MFTHPCPNVRNYIQIRGPRARVADERERRRVRALEELNTRFPIGVRVDSADGRGRQGSCFQVEVVHVLSKCVCSCPLCCLFVAFGRVLPICLAYTLATHAERFRYVYVSPRSLLLCAHYHLLVCGINLWFEAVVEARVRDPGSPLTPVLGPPKNSEAS